MSSLLFLSGISFATFAACGIFFLKFFKSSHDRLFMFFAGACWLLAIEKLGWLYINAARTTVGPSETMPDFHISIYLLRLFAFAMIMIGIIEKNLARKTLD